MAAKDWLKIGLHATNSSSNFSSASYETGKNTWNSFVNNVVRITGSYLSVDRMPRLHMFAGSEDALKGMRDANYGAIGFLSADDTRNSYYFDDGTKTYLYNNDHITDYKNGLIFVATDLRTDWFAGTSASYTYKAPTKSTVYDELVERYTNVEFANSTSSYILFGHEWKIYNGTTITDTGKQYYEDACRFASEYQIAFDYSQNRAFNPTPYDIYPNSSSSEDEGDTTVTTILDGQTLTVVDKFSNVEYVNGSTLNGYLKYVDLTGRAVSKTQLLKVTDDMRVLSLDLSKLSITNNLQYTVYQFTDLPLSTTTFLDTTGAGTWTQEDIALQPTTQYIMIVFKNNTGTAFTDEDVALLNTCVSFSSGITYYDRTLIGTNNINDMTFTSGYSISGAALGDFTTASGRAACVDMVLEVNGGETLSFVENLEEIFGSTDLYFAVDEFSEAPLSSTTLSNSSSNNACGKAWLSSDHTLQSNTRYVLIAFKNGDGSTNFSTEQLAKLNQCLQLTSTTE